MTGKDSQRKSSKLLPAFSTQVAAEFPFKHSILPGAPQHQANGDTVALIHLLSAQWVFFPGSSASGGCDLITSEEMKSSPQAQLTGPFFLWIAKKASVHIESAPHHWGAETNAGAHYLQKRAQGPWTEQSKRGSCIDLHQQKEEKYPLDRCSLLSAWDESHPQVLKEKQRPLVERPPIKSHSSIEFPGKKNIIELSQDCLMILPKTRLERGNLWLVKSKRSNTPHMSMRQ